MKKSIKILASGCADNHPYLKPLHNAIKKNKEIFIYDDIKHHIDFFIRSKDVDLLHLHWIEHLTRWWAIHQCVILLWTPTYLSFIIFIKYVLQKKLVITLHNVKSHIPVFPKLEEFVFKFFINISDAVIVHNEYTKKEAIKLYKVGDKNAKKIKIIPHGNFISYYENKISKKEARKSLNIPSDKFVLLFLGSIRPKTRGIEDLLKVLEDIFNTDKSFFVVFAGACMDQSLEKQIIEFSNNFKKNSLLNLEFIPDDDIQIYMNAADVGILPLKQISTSGSLILHMSFKNPVIISELEPIKELLGDYSLYCDPNSKGSLKRTIIKAKNIDLEKVSNELYEIAEKYDWDKIGELTAEVYKSVLNDKI